MKAKISIVAIIMIAFIAISATPIKPFTLKAGFKNTTDGFSFVRLHRQGKGAAICWAFTSANATGFTVQRTYEDPSDPTAWWETVSNTACNSSRSYKCIDGSVTPGFVSYRVIAMLNDGNTIASDISTLKFMGH